MRYDAGFNLWVGTVNRRRRHLLVKFTKWHDGEVLCNYRNRYEYACGKIDNNTYECRSRADDAKCPQCLAWEKQQIEQAKA